jgi:hypothetical protein
MTYLAEVPDPRRRQARVYPLSGLLGMLVLAALNGETSLRGMWIWGREHWERIKERLGMAQRQGAPQYGTVWNVLSRLPVGVLGAALRKWVQEVEVEVEVVSVDGKVLRGSKRRSGLAALEMMVAAAQGVGVVLDQAKIEEGDAVEAALRLLQGLSLEGKVVTLDAGLHHAGVAEAVLGKGGPA